MTNLGITGYQTNHCNAQVFDLYRFGSDLIVLNNIGSGNPSVNNHPVSNQSNHPNHHVVQESDAYRDELDPSVQTKD